MFEFTLRYPTSVAAESSLLGVFSPIATIAAVRRDRPDPFFEAMTSSERPSSSRDRARARGDESATRFRGIVDAHFQFIWRYLRGLGVFEAHVDDAAQQVFIVASQKLDAIEVGRERSFLIGTALGVAANARRAQARHRDVDGDAPLERQPDLAPNPEEAAQSQQAIHLLDRFLESLPEELRTVFILFELEGMTMAAIAEATGTPPGTVASRLRRARDEFHAMSKRVQNDPRTKRDKRDGRDGEAGR